MQPQTVSAGEQRYDGRVEGLDKCRNRTEAWLRKQHLKNYAFWTA